MHRRSTCSGKRRERAKEHPLEGILWDLLAVPEFQDLVQYDLKSSRASAVLTAGPRAHGSRAWKDHTWAGFKRGVWKSPGYEKSA